MQPGAHRQVRVCGAAREQAGAVSGTHLEAAQALPPTPIRNSLYIILICLWGPGSKVMRLLLLFFGWKLQQPLYKLHIIESIRGSFS